MGNGAIGAPLSMSGLNQPELSQPCAASRTAPGDKARAIGRFRIHWPE